MLINIVLGSSFYLFGTLNLYIASYFRANYPSFSLESSLIIFPIMSISFHSAAPFSVRLCEKIGFRFYMFLCLFLFSSAYFFALSISSLWGFFFLYGFLSGFSSGLTYLIPLYNAYKYFPLRRGLISGLILGAYGFGSMISSPILMAFLNPQNTRPMEESSTGDYYFPKEICDNLTYSLRMLSVFFFVFGCVGILFCIEYQEDEECVVSVDEINYPKENTKALIVELIENNDDKSSPMIESAKNSKLSKISQFTNKIKNSVFNSKIGVWSKATINPEDETHCQSLFEGLKSPLFWLLLAMFTFSSCGGCFLAANYKNLGILSIPDDSFLNIVGSVGAISNGAGRVLWGMLMDRYKFNKSFLILLALELVEGLILRFILEIKWIYLILVGLGFFCLGGHPVLFPTFCIKSFGAKIGAEVYGILFWGMCFGNLMQTVVVLGLKQFIGFQNLRFLFLGGTILCFCILRWGRLKF